MDRLKGFMIMPLLSEDDKKEMNDIAQNDWSLELRKKVKCQEFYENIVKGACDRLDIHIKQAFDFYNTQDIIDKITSAIKSSHIFIVDLTLYRPNVMYELGIAHCLDPDLTLLITQEDYDNTPFDIQGIENLKYESDSGKYTDIIVNKLTGIKSTFFKKNMCIGISQYPELMVLVRNLNHNETPISHSIVPWNRTFEALDGTSTIDFVIANYELHMKKNREIGDTVYLYRPTLIKYNSFYIICKEEGIKTFKDLKTQSKSIKNTINELFDQLNKLEKTIKVFACEETDHLESFSHFNNLYGTPLLKSPSLQKTGSPKEILRDFIKSDGGLFIGGIPERVNLLKQSEFSLFIETNDFKHSPEVNSKLKYFQQSNGIVYHVDYIESNKDARKYIDIIKDAWKLTWSEIIDLYNNRDENRIDEYLLDYNDSEYVKTFNYRGVELKVSAKDFFASYLDDNLIVVE